MTAEPEVLYQFKIHLSGISPMIWRRFIVSSDTNIAELHYIIQLVMGWDDSHLNCFKIYGKDYGVYHSGGMMFDDNPMDVLLKDLRPTKNWKFTYEYNFTENWEHQVRLEKILPYEPTFKSPVCLDGKRACPPEDIGGKEIYDQFLTDLFHRQMKVWARLGAIFTDQRRLKTEINESADIEGYWWEHLLFDSEYFDREKVNESLAELYQNKGDTFSSLADSFQQVFWDMKINA